MDRKLQNLSRADLVALLREFAPADELELRVKSLLQQKTESSEIWCRDSAKALTEEADAASAIGAILETLQSRIPLKTDLPNDQKGQISALTERTKTDRDEQIEDSKDT